MTWGARWGERWAGVADAGAPASYTLTAAAGAFTLAGQSATLLRSKVLPASAGAFTLTGQAATLTHTAAGAYSLTANAGSFTITGSAAQLLRGYRLAAGAGSFALSGQAATLTHAVAATDHALILKILSNRQELNAATGKFVLYDDDSTTILYQSNAWADAAGTIPYSGGVLARIDRLT